MCSKFLLLNQFSYILYNSLSNNNHLCILIHNIIALKSITSLLFNNPLVQKFIFEYLDC